MFCLPGYLIRLHHSSGQEVCAPHQLPWTLQLQHVRLQSFFYTIMTIIFSPWLCVSVIILIQLECSFSSSDIIDVTLESHSSSKKVSVAVLSSAISVHFSTNHGLPAFNVCFFWLVHRRSRLSVRGLHIDHIQQGQIRMP